MTGIMQALAGASIGLTNPVVFDFTSGSGATVTAPDAAQNVQIEVWGPGGGGSHGVGSGDTADFGNGGASGGYARSNYAIAAGQTLHYTVGTPGIGEPAGDNTQYAGSASVVSSGTLAIATMTANGGQGSSASAAGVGGSVAGGNSADIPGNAGGYVGGGDGILAGGNAAGAGGASGYGAAPGRAGGVGRVIFTFT